MLLRRAEIAALVVGDLHQNRGCDSLRVTPKGRCSARFATTAKTRRTSRASYIDEREQHAIVWKRPDKKFEITI